LTGNTFKFLALFCVMVSGCSYVLDEPKLSKNRINDEQQIIEIEVQPLTSDTVKKLNNQKFIRNLVITEQDQSKLAANKLDFLTNPLPTTSPVPYKIGTGDVIELISYDHTDHTRRTGSAIISPTASPPSFLSAQGIGQAAPLTDSRLKLERSRVGADGSILFISTGKLDVRDKTLPEVRFLVNDALVRNGLDTRFQLEISEFNSQKVSLVSYNIPINNLNSVSEIGTALFPITETPLSLTELLVGAGLLLKKNVIELVTVQRGDQVYQTTLKHIFDHKTPKYFLLGGDLITVESFKYKQENAYALGGLSIPFIIPLAEEEPVSLANALFRPGGVLASQASKKSEVFLLRGKAPMIAYQLNVTDPARLSLSAELELRPDDIIFASTVPIVDFNRILQLINPLRILTGQNQALFSPAF